jgi:hypothetical protein
LTGEPPTRPQACGTARLRQTITCGLRVASPGIIPAPAHFAQSRATCGHRWATSIIAGPGTGCERCSFTDRGSFLLLGCAARCQTTLEREQAVPTQESFSGTDCLFDELIATTLPNGSATSGYRFPGRTSHPFVGRSEHHNVQQSKQRKESTLTSGQQMAAQTIIIHAQG